MSFNNKKLLITLLSLCTFQTYAAQCTAEIFAKNKLNNFILLSQPTRTEIPKSVSITIDSPDGYPLALVSVLLIMDIRLSEDIWIQIEQLVLITIDTYWNSGSRRGADTQ